MAADVVLLLVLAGGFMLGFFRGLVRQTLAVGAWLVVFVGAAYLRAPLGDWLASSSPQFGRDYSLMLAFLVIFVGVLAAAVLLVEFGGAPSKLVRHPVLDDALGGLLGLVLAALVIASVMVILRSYFWQAPTALGGELGWLRDAYGALEGSTVGRVIAEWIVRIMGAVLSPLLPADVRIVMV